VSNTGQITHCQGRSIAGAWLIVARWLLEAVASPLAAWSGVIRGVFLIALAIPRGPVKDSYAGWNRYVF
jgi:hypothetical protein